MKVFPHIIEYDRFGYCLQIMQVHEVVMGKLREAVSYAINARGLGLVQHHGYKEGFWLPWQVLHGIT
jgi:hypothetical protein